MRLGSVFFLLGLVWSAPSWATKPKCEWEKVAYIQWDKEMVLAKLDLVAKSKRPKIPLNRASVEKQNTKLVKEITGVSGSYLVELAIEHVAPTWDGVLEAMGENVLETRKHIFLTPKQFKQAIRALAAAKRPIHAAALQDDQSPETRAVLKKELGSAISGAQVYWAGYSKNGGNWAKALRAAELNPETYVRKRQWDRDELLAIAKLLNKRKVPLNVLSLYQPGYGEILWAECGIGTSGQAFYRAAVKEFGAWDNFLIAAGLNPYEIRRHFWRRGHLSTTPNQTETGTRWIGTAPEDPSDIAVGREFLARLRTVINKLPGHSRQLGAQVADEVLGSGEKLDAAAIAKSLGRKKDEVEAILKRFKDSSLFSPDAGP